MATKRRKKTPVALSGIDAELEAAFDRTRDKLSSIDTIMRAKFPELSPGSPTPKEARPAVDEWKIANAHRNAAFAIWTGGQDTEAPEVQQEISRILALSEKHADQAIALAHLIPTPESRLAKLLK